MAFRPIVITAALDPGLPAFERHGEPVAVGVPCPRGAVARSTRWTLTDQRGRTIPAQTTVRDQWGDGSVRWLLTEFQADVDADPHSFYALAPDAAGSDAGPAIAIERAGEFLRVSTGVATIDVPRSGTAFIAAAEAGGRQVLDTSAIVAEDAQGARYAFSVRRAAIERAGSQRAVIHLDGALSCAERRRFLDANVRLHFFAGLGTVKVDLSVASPRGAVPIRDLSIRIVAARGGTSDIWSSIDRHDRMAPAGRRFAVRQESSGGPQREHEIAGLRATPIVSMGGGDTRISVALPYFWGAWPKGLSADATVCEVAMFPRGTAHDLHDCERRTATVWVCFGRDTVTAQPLAWVRSPLRVCVNPLSAFERARPTRPLVSLLARRLAGTRSEKA